MVDFLDYLYSFFEDKYYLLRKFRVYSAFRFIIRAFSNSILSAYFTLTKNRTINSLNIEAGNNPKYIISLTSFPARINKIWIVIESLLRQSFKPDMIILWLSSEQFTDISTLPQKLLDMQKRGLTIQFREDNLRSHKKYYYALKEYSNDYIITVDDDVIYNSKFLLYLIQMNRVHPSAICCNCASKIHVINNKIAPYIQWEAINRRKLPSFEIMPIGVGGVLYPPNSFSSDVLLKDVFMNICPLADDIWLNIMSRFNNVKVAKTHFNSNYLPVLHKNNLTLNSENVTLGENDKQLEAVRKYLISEYSIDPYNSLFI